MDDERTAQRTASRGRALSTGSGEALARGLGWFSIALGMTEVAAPGALTRRLGMEGREALVRTYGLREIANGIGILSAKDQTAWIRGRVGGDTLDLATLASGFTRRNPKRGNVGLALAAVAGVTLLDLLCSQQLSRRSYRVSGDTPDTGALPEASAGQPEIERSITIGKSADELYRLWREPRTLPRIMGHFAEVAVADGDIAHWTVHAPLGRTVEWSTRIIEDKPGELVRWESVDAAALPNEGSVRFRPAPGDRGTEVSLKVRFDPPGGGIGASVVGLLEAVPRTIASKALRRFKSLAETGEIATNQRQPAARKGGHDE